MMRKCDGTDQLLVTADNRPCQCGAEFDDVEYSTVFPHQSVKARHCWSCFAAVCVSAFVDGAWVDRWITLPGTVSLCKHRTIAAV